MKEFRVAKCLVNGLISEYAIFADGSRKKLIRKVLIMALFFLYTLYFFA